VVRKGEALLILEAMKMENVLKAPSDLLISEIKVVQGQAVEKNQPLILFG
jgi:biotin carboxyl carrier protein